jgi:predicted nucleic acid-binding protein
VRAVLDTNVLVSGLIWKASPRQVLDAARDKRLTLYTSGVLLDELAEVLSRRHLASVIACALAAQADWIVSGDAHLLNLKHYQGMRIIDAAEALRALVQ